MQGVHDVFNVCPHGNKYCGIPATIGLPKNNFPFSHPIFRPSNSEREYFGASAGLFLNEPYLEMEQAGGLPINLPFFILYKNTTFFKVISCLKHISCQTIKAPNIVPFL